MGDHSWHCTAKRNISTINIPAACAIFTEGKFVNNVSVLQFVHPQSPGKYIKQQLDKPPADICESHIVSGLKQGIESFQAVREILQKEKQTDDLPVTTRDMLSNVYDMGTMGQQVHRSQLIFRLKDFNHDEPRYIRYMDNSDGDPSIPCRQIPYIP